MTKVRAVEPTRQRRPRYSEPKHLAFIKSLTCLRCAARHSDAHHLKPACRWAGKPSAGSMKNDKFTVPLCRLHHDELHTWGNEVEWWVSRFGPYGWNTAVGVALALWAATGDEQLGEKILRWNR